MIGGFETHHRFRHAYCASAVAKLAKRKIYTAILHAFQACWLHLFSNQTSTWDILLVNSIQFRRLGWKSVQSTACYETEFPVPRCIRFSAPSVKSRHAPNVRYPYYQQQIFRRRSERFLVQSFSPMCRQSCKMNSRVNQTTLVTEMFTLHSDRFQAARSAPPSSPPFLTTCAFWHPFVYLSSWQ